jgi:hypothetical protein|tara:strand:+ start:12279 stop:12905 length:627 start_codon:yes stop_codon:yes gene_type:complete
VLNEKELLNTRTFKAFEADNYKVDGDGNKSIVFSNAKTFYDFFREVLMDTEFTNATMFNQPTAHKITACLVEYNTQTDFSPYFPTMHSFNLAFQGIDNSDFKFAELDAEDKADILKTLNIDLVALGINTLGMTYNELYRNIRDIYKFRGDRSSVKNICEKLVRDKWLIKYRNMYYLNTEMLKYAYFFNVDVTHIVIPETVDEFESEDC